MRTDLSALVGKNVKKLRTERGLTQEELANGAGVSPSYLRDIEHGKANPTVTIVEKISCQLQVLPARMFQTEEESK